MNSYKVLKDLNDVNLGFDKSNIDNIRSIFVDRDMWDLYVSKFPSYVSLQMSSLMDINNVSEDQAKEILDIFQNKLIPYHILYGKPVDAKTVISNSIDFLKRLESFTMKLLDSNESFDTREEVEKWLQTEYNIHDIDYETLEKLIIEMTLI